MQKAREQLAKFLFAADPGDWLTFLRLGLATQVIFYAWSLRHEWSYIFSSGSGGRLDRALAEAIVSAETRWTPRLGWLVAAGQWINLSQSTVLSLVWLLLLVAGFFLLLGLLCRPAAICAWFLYLCSVKSGELLAYGVDTLATIGLFYLMIAPLPDRFALDWKFRIRRPIDPERVGFHRRVLQFHLTVIYFFGGISKSLGTDWWNGNSVWRALIRPPFNLISPDLLAHAIPLLTAIGIAVCVLETGYPVFIWWRRTRLAWLVSILGMHLAIGLTMGLYLFGLIMIVLNLAAFAPFRRRPMKNEFLQKA